jgi:DNA-binding CsgD family transcriptional regulator
MIRLLALQMMEKGQTVRDRAVLLSKAGLSSREIAVLCDTTPNTISVALSNAKKESKG